VIRRERATAPEGLTASAGPALARLKEYDQRSQREKAQRRWPFEHDVVQTADVVQALVTLGRGMCAYCETLTPTPLVDRFRPTEEAASLDGRTVARDHYWWLAYEWENLYPACPTCMSHKGKRFPVKGPRAAPAPGRGLPTAEHALFLDPCRDQPERSLAYEEDGRVVALDERAATTIEGISLNRVELVANRARAADEARTIIGRAISGEADATELGAQLEGRLPYTGIRRFVVKESLDAAVAERADIPHAVLGTVGSFTDWSIRPVESAKAGERPPDHWVGSTADGAGSIRLERIEIDHYKAIKHLELVFREPFGEQEPWLLLLGENGVGKSSVLKAVTLALMDPAARAERVPNASTSVRIGGRARRGRVKLTLSDGSVIEMTFQRGDEAFRTTGRQPPFLVLGSGPTRLPPPPHFTPGPLERLRVGNLFDALASLRDVERWLADTEAVPTASFNLHATDLKAMLPMDADERLLRRAGRVFARTNGVTVPLPELSDGFRSVIALATDMMQHFAASYESMTTAEGLVLLDEVEVHLHPRWRMTVISQLRTVFPRVRFIATSHDPLCLQQTEAGEVVVMRRGSDRGVYAEVTNVPKGLRADQLLTGDWFGLGTTVDAETAKFIEDHGKLLLKKQTKDVRQQRAVLEETLRGRLGHFAETSVERLAQDVAAEVTAGQDLREVPVAQRNAMRDDILAEVERRRGRR
jgi:predicted ATPase